MATPLVAAAQSSGLSLDSAQPAAVGEPGRALLDRALTGTNNRAPAALSNYSVYIVRLADAPAASYAGGVAGLAATSMRATGADKFSLSTPAATAYNAYLDGRHREFGAACDATLGRHVEPLYDYKVAFNGMALALTTEEAAALASVPGVVSVEREKQYQFDTDVGPEWIGAPAVWDDHPPFASSHGEGVVVAILDSGINHDHPAFADVGSDGYDHTNPLGSGNYIPGSYCDVTDPTFCNDKLIGAWDMVQSAADPGAPEDDDGHGSHTAGTVAGNFVTGATINAPTTSFVRNTSGVAPHANIIAYDVCIDSCPGAALVGALDQVVIDAAALPNGIAALNYSISGDGNPWSNAVEQGFFNASVAGIFVSASAGNSGAADTVAHESPWISTVAALTHNRRIDNNLTGLSSNGAALSDVVGAGLTAGFGPAPIVYAGNFPTSNGSQNDTDPAQCLDPFPAGTFNGEIVVCDRGSIARTAKGANVAAGGAGGFVLANVDAQGESIVADAHVIPGVHVGDADGDVLRAWLAANENTVASISGFVTDLSTANGDVMAGFSSRGPANNLDILKPDVGAPGVSVMAPVETPPTGGQGEYAFLSGTSMSSPHNAGAGALLSAVTNWSPYEIKSALMLTAEKPFRVMDSDGVTEADMFDTGAGRIHVPAAQEAGLIMDETPANFIAANPAEGGDPRTLNLASLSNFACYGECSWTRTFKNPTSVTQTFDFEPRSEDGVEITATPDSITVPAGGSATVTFEANMDFTTEGW
ncbi:MAG: S8 family serine peptidase, partial [Myxococcota bacterium]